MAIAPTASRTAFPHQSRMRPTGWVSIRAACSTIEERQLSLVKTTPMSHSSMEEIIGSIPIRSTNFKPKTKRSRSFRPPAQDATVCVSTSLERVAPTMTQSERSCPPVGLDQIDR